MGVLEAIWLKRAHGGPMDPVDEAVAVEGRGLEGGADFDGHRQVTLIEREVFVGDLRIQIHGETRPCGRMDEACEGLMNALDPHWSGGAHGSVVNDATISVGDEVRWEESR